MRVVIERVFRIGRQCLWFDDETLSFFISLENRTYRNFVKITPEQAGAFCRLIFGKESYDSWPAALQEYFSSSSTSSPNSCPKDT